MKRNGLRIVLVLILLVLIISGVYYFGIRKGNLGKLSSQITSERIDKPTPNGGAYSISYFSDDKKNPVTKDQATRVEIVEYSKDGTELFRTYGFIEK